MVLSHAEVTALASHLTIDELEYSSLRTVAQFAGMEAAVRAAVSNPWDYPASVKLIRQMYVAMYSANLSTRQLASRLGVSDRTAYEYLNQPIPTCMRGALGSSADLCDDTD